LALGSMVWGWLHPPKPDPFSTGCSGFKMYSYVVQVSIYVLFLILGVWQGESYQELLLHFWPFILLGHDLYFFELKRLVNNFLPKAERGEYQGNGRLNLEAQYSLIPQDVGSFFDLCSFDHQMGDLIIKM